MEVEPIIFREKKGMRERSERARERVVRNRNERARTHLSGVSSANGDYSDGDAMLLCVCMFTNAVAGM